jgi:hypothetical protein
MRAGIVVIGPRIFGLSIAGIGDPVQSNGAQGGWHFLSLVYQSLEGGW